MTKREYIRECKRLHKEIERSGLSKFGFLETPAGKKWWDKDYEALCPLCEYTASKESDCDDCPLVLQYGKDCLSLGYSGLKISAPEWFEAVRNLKE